MNQDMYRDVYYMMKMGFPMLWVVASAMAMTALWKDTRKTRNQKYYWSAVILLLPFLGVGIYLGWGYR